MFSMLTLVYALNTYLTLTKINKYCIWWSFTLFTFFFSVHLFFLGWLFVTYGMDLVSMPRYYILVSYRSQNQAIPTRDYID